MVNTGFGFTVTINESSALVHDIRVWVTKNHIMVSLAVGGMGAISVPPILTLLVGYHKILSPYASSCGASKYWQNVRSLSIGTGGVWRMITVSLTGKEEHPFR
jgi:hypothetical protein